MEISSNEIANMTGIQVVMEHKKLFEFMSAPENKDDVNDKTITMMAGDRYKALQEVHSIATKHPQKYIGDMLEIDKKEQQLHQLLKGLLVPNIEIWIKQDPETLLLISISVPFLSGDTRTCCDY